jgi:hypothetical protein
MEDYNRRKKSDKGKEKFERNGKNSTKHIRLVEKLKEKTQKIDGKSTNFLYLLKWQSFKLLSVVIVF